MTAAVTMISGIILSLRAVLLLIFIGILFAKAKLSFTVDFLFYYILFIEPNQDDIWFF
jgi:hypothetical protein